jgi:hypothetical protein
LILLKPVEAKKGNGTVLLEIPNRGTDGVLNMFQREDSLLFEQGFTVVDVGWQFDNPKGLRMYPPSAAGVRGFVRGQLFRIDRRPRFSCRIAITSLMPL